MIGKIKKNIILKGSLCALGVLGAGLLSSCSMEDDAFVRDRGMLAGKPKVTAYSGNHFWGAPTGIVATRAQDLDWTRYKKVQDNENNNWDDPWQQQNNPYYPYRNNAPQKTDRGESVSTAEYEYVIEYIRTHQGGLECNLSTYFIQNVGSSMDHYRYDYHDGQNNVDRSAEFTGGNQMDYLTIGGYHIGDYNATGGPRALVIDAPVNAPEVSPTYHDSWGTIDNTKENAYRFFIITLPDDPIYGENAGKTAYYLGFDYRTAKWDNGDIDYKGDGIFNDWVVKLTPGDGSLITPPNEDGDDDHGHEGEEGDELCADCQHSAHFGMVCEECVSEGNISGGVCKAAGAVGGAYPDNGDNDNPENPGNNNPGNDNPGTVTPPVDKGYNEVEANLAVDRKNHDLLESHLSIHVRTATDVEVFIPVPAQYYCAADDMEIVLNHQNGNFLHGGPEKVEYQVGNNIVTVTIAFEEKGIRITTDGITQDVIDYCWENFQDGITFEVWNYFNNPETGLPYIDMDVLKELLDQATIKFLDKNPGRYINAFGRDNDKYSDENRDGNDFHIVLENESDFSDPVVGPHLNGSDINEIYTLLGQSDEPEESPEEA